VKLTFVRLLVDDFPACFRFYRDVMRLTPTYGDESGGYADFDAGADVSLALFVREYQTDHVGTTSSANGDKAVVVFQVDDVDRSLDELRKRGAPVSAEPADRSDWGIRVAYVRDPDGNLIELNQPIGLTEAAA
jgi:catechol 2,3-dioxygenase-like lactoylglutathione lyase family enzyme